MKTIQIETERLRMRPLERQDLAGVCLLDTDPEVRSFFPEGELAPDQARRELERNISEWEKWGYGIFATFEKKTNSFIGRCGFARLASGVIEFGYLLLKPYWGLGYATEATQAILNWGFAHTDIDRVVGFAPVDHVASLRVLEKVGMVFCRKDFYQGIECAFYEIQRSTQLGEAD